MNSGTPVFSIIIPIYNAQGTIERCLNSIKDQSFTDYEVIIVDDCSKDESRDIVSKYSESDPRFSLYRLRQNSGPSAARNMGIDMATGRIVTFIDADDYVLPEYLDKINKAFTELDADVVFFEFFKATENGELYHHKLPEFVNDGLDGIVSLTTHDMFGYTWLKAIKRATISNTRFDESVHLFEDEIFTCNVMMVHPQIELIHQPLYVYVRSQESLFTKENPEYPICCEGLWQSWKKLLDGSFGWLLTKKANQMAENCKWYSLERASNPIKFWKLMQRCEFLWNVSVDDIFFRTVKKGYWGMLVAYRTKYQIRVMLSHLLPHKRKVKT